MLNLLDVVNHDGIEAFDGVLHVEEVLTTLAVSPALGNYDYYASYGHNYYLYESTPGRFTTLPWDMNFSQTDLSSPCGLGRNDEDWPLSHTLLAPGARGPEYFDAQRVFLSGAGSAASLSARLDAVLPVVGEHLDDDQVEELSDRFTQRVDDLNDALAEDPTSCREREDWR